MKMICTKCKKLVKKTVLDSHEYEKGISLKGVDGYECLKYKELVFTEKQIDEIEKRTDAIKIHKFSFNRNLAKGMTTKLIPFIDRNAITHLNDLYHLSYSLRFLKQCRTYKVFSSM